VLRPSPLPRTCPPPAAIGGPAGTLLYCLNLALPGTPLTILIDNAAAPGLNGAPAFWGTVPGTLPRAGASVTVKPAAGAASASIGGPDGLALPNAGASVTFENVRFVGGASHLYSAQPGSTLAFTDCEFQPTGTLTGSLVAATGAGAKVALTRVHFINPIADTTGARTRR
jgi:hypothetical protein